MTESAFTRNLKKWFWGSFLLQLCVFSISAVWFSASISSTVGQHGTDIKLLQTEMQQKADINTVMRIKSDNDRIQQMILEDVKYIRQRIDEHMDRDTR